MLCALGALSGAPLRAEETPRPVGSPPPATSTSEGFSFGSYGRVSIGIDGRGHQGYGTNVVSRGSRLESLPYIELDLYYTGRIGNSDARWRIVVAPAFNGDLFHYNGNFSSNFAVRNAYAETDGLGYKGLNIWAGSRQLRGDDIYLVDYWPLDNLNTVGGGAFLKLGNLQLQLHAGLNRLNQPTTFQTILVPARGLGAPGQALVLDRPRTVVSFKATYFFHRGERGAKLSFYGEGHYLPEGQQVFVSQQRTERLPLDTGFVLGGQLGLWLRPFTFANVFVRYARGLAAVGELNAPRVFDADRRTASTQELVAATSFNYETKIIGVNVGAYFRLYREPVPGQYNRGNYNEGIVIVRPHLYVTPGGRFQVATEFSYQGREYGGFDPVLNRRLTPRVFRASILPLVAPFGRGTYSRPIIYAVATLSVLNDDARVSLFEESDIRRPNSRVVYLGLGAEWWFQSSYR